MIRWLAGVLAACALAGCGQEVTVPVPGPAPGAGQPQFGATERAFVELAIATDDQAVKLLDAGTAATVPALRELAQDIGTARRAEVVELRGLLAHAAITYVNNHEGHDMPGMPTDDEIVALRGSGTGFDAMFVKLVRAHLDESATVVHSAVQAVADEPTRALARRMAQDRVDFVRRLNKVGVAG